LENLLGRLQENVGVDQGASAQPGTDHGVHAGVVADIKHTAQSAFADVLWAISLFVRQVPEIGRHLMGRAGKRSHWIALAAFKEQHSVFPLLCESTASDGTAEAAADDDCFK